MVARDVQAEAWVPLTIFTSMRAVVTLVQKHSSTEMRQQLFRRRCSRIDWAGKSADGDDILANVFCIADWLCCSFRAVDHELHAESTADENGIGAARRHSRKHLARSIWGQHQEIHGILHHIADNREEYPTQAHQKQYASLVKRGGRRFTGKSKALQTSENYSPLLGMTLAELFHKQRMMSSPDCDAN